MERFTAEEMRLFALIQEAVKKVLKEQGVSRAERWIDTAEAMSLLTITSKTTLQKMRDEGKIAYSQPEKKIILYDRESIEAYIQKHVKKPFA